MTIDIGDIPAPATLRRPDGRALAWYEFGDRDGVPCVYTPGTPESGVVGAFYDPAAKRHGVRWIAMDKPGYGHSDEQPDRALPDWAGDVALVADHLGIDRFAAVGESGGGPHAITIGAVLADRVSSVTAIGGAAAGELWVRRPVARFKPSNQRLFWLVDNDPAGLAAFLTEWKAACDDPVAGAELLTTLYSSDEVPPDDQEIMAAPGVAAVHAEAFAAAFRRGVSACSRELRMFTEPWGFELAKVTVPVSLWHGAADGNVPVDIAEGIAARLPDATLHVVPEAGHLVGYRVADDIMAEIRAVWS